MTKLQRKIATPGSTELTCAVCGVKFTRPNAHIRGETHSCSKKCAYIAKPKKLKTLIDCECKECGKKFRIRKGRGGTGEYCSIPCLAAARGRNMRKEKHHKWNGGSSKRSYASRKAIQQMIKEHGKCEECGSAHDLQGHHKNPHSTHIPERADPKNIQVLCKICHAKKHPRLAAFILAGRIRA